MEHKTSNKPKFTVIMNSNLVAAEATANNDRHPNTIKGYKRIINTMKEFARVQEGWDEGIFDNPPLPDEFFKEFMGMQSQLKDDGSVKTAATLRKNVSALKWWYSTQKPPVDVSPELNIFLTRFNKGHKCRAEARWSYGPARGKSWVFLWSICILSQGVS